MMGSLEPASSLPDSPQKWAGIKRARKNSAGLFQKVRQLSAPECFGAQADDELPGR